MGRTQPFGRLLDEVREIAGSRRSKDEKLGMMCVLLKQKVPRYNWVGFYLASGAKKELALGAFAGEPTEHIRIPYGSGICGQAALAKKTFVVQDVSKEANYLSCGPKVKSEIVVPVLKGRNFVAELDIDSHAIAPFSEEDRKFLEKVCKIVSGLF